MRKKFEALGLVMAGVFVWSAYPHTSLPAQWLCQVAFGFLAMLLLHGVVLEGHFGGPCMVILFMVGLFGECVECMIPWPEGFGMAGIMFTAPLDVTFEMMGGLAALLIVKARVGDAA